MNKLVLYCKSYRGDYHRALHLLESVKVHNVDKIPFYISVPSVDVQLFRDKLGTDGYTLISDEEIDTDGAGWQGQQIVKSQFWKLGLCKNYVCLDSDVYFIKDFFVNDFMYDDETPYTVCHEQKDFFEFMYKNPMGFDPKESFDKDRLFVMNLFDRRGTIYDFGPGPTIWSTLVWNSLFNEYLHPNNLTFADLIKQNPSEFTWYGEWLLINNTIKLYPRQPLFKAYHYKHQYEMDKIAGYTVDNIKKTYMGIGLQSNWNAPLNY